MKFQALLMVSGKCRSGITLTETLIVIAVFGVIASLLLSVAGRAREAGQEAASMGNLRQMGAALATSAADHQGTLIEGANYPSLNGRKYRFWFDALDCYMNGEGTTAQEYFPTARPGAQRAAWQSCPKKVFRDSPLFQGWGVGVGYGWNYLNFGYIPGETPKMGWGSKLTQISEPGRTIIIGTSVDSTTQADRLQHTLIYSDPGSVQTLMARRFNGRGLYLFLDGHVQALTPEEAMANNGYFFRRK